MVDNNRSKKFVVVFIALFAVLLAGLIAVLQKDAIYSQLDNWKLIPRPERLTELFFTNHKYLASSYTPGKAQDINFSVRNLEYRRTTYYYQVVQQSQDDKKNIKLASGNIYLNNDESKSITLKPKLHDMGDNALIVVKINYQAISFGQDVPTNQSQSIHYQINKIK